MSLLGVVERPLWVQGSQGRRLCLGTVLASVLALLSQGWGWPGAGEDRAGR